VLQEEGYIDSYEEFEEKKGVKHIRVALRYHRGRSALEVVRRVSKPGRRVYAKISEVTKPYNGLGIFILTTPKGIVSDRVARAHGVGGEILCSVF
jgi:small subunit ribosomal protein S8